MKIGYIAALLISVGVFNSCTENLVRPKIATKETSVSTASSRPQTAYGSYLAARVAHIRQDLDTAADYYVQSIKFGADRPEIVGRVYVLLTSEGRIDEAAQYAKTALSNGDKSNIIRLIIMTDNLHKGQFTQAHESLGGIKDKIYQSTVSPLFQSWIYAGEGNKKQALKTLEPFQKESQSSAFYYMHMAMINDYFDDSIAAQKYFDTVVDDNKLEISFRSLQIISNFYIRNNQKEKAEALVKKYYNKNRQAKMLRELAEDIKKADPKSQAKLIDTAQKGASEAIFNIGTIFRDGHLEIAQIFTALGLYLNPEHDVARISMANLLETNLRFTESIKEYEKIGRNSPIYFMAQLKIASNHMAQKQNQKALKKLNQLLAEYPRDYQVLFNLGEINRVMNRQAEAIQFYNKALDVMPQSEADDWTVYYALGIAYERNDQWDKAEKALKKALETSNRNPFVLNYLGYMWLKYNQNPNEALYMIFEAYRQNPEDGHIMDSLGWALYRMGKYNDAIKVLERAAEYLPANAIVCDHLGDAYWQVGRKAEAKFQWQHALTLKEDAEELNQKEIRQKIAQGASAPTPIAFNEPLLVKRLKSLNLEE